LVLKLIEGLKTELRRLQLGLGAPLVFHLGFDGLFKLGYEL
jgi:hypothetical protein